VDLAVKDCETKLDVREATCFAWYEDEMPRHRVSLDAYYLDVHEVTNHLFEQFVESQAYRTTAEREGWAKAWIEGRGLQAVKGANWRRPEGALTRVIPHRPQHPVISVSWEDAQAYCHWAGKRLPTEAEWEYAARAGTETLFWWGNDDPKDRRVGNIADESARGLIGGIVEGYHDGYPRTAPVGSFEPNPWGLQEMTGNVAEWTQDWYGGRYPSEPEHNPQGVATAKYRIIRGGSWANGPLRARSANRDWDTPSYRHDTVGFRCAMDVPKELLVQDAKDGHDHKEAKDKAGKEQKEQKEQKESKELKPLPRDHKEHK
jgi:formylglycine-generating enzyme required for sulfatase activity